MDQEKFLTIQDLNQLEEQGIINFHGGMYEVSTIPKWLRFSVGDDRFNFDVELFDDDDDIPDNLDRDRDDFAVIPLKRFLFDDDFTEVVLDQIFSVCVVPQLAKGGTRFVNIVEYYKRMTIEAGYERKEGGQVVGVEYSAVSCPEDDD